MSISLTLDSILPQVSCGLMLEYLSQHGLTFDLSDDGPSTKLSDEVQKAIKRASVKKREEVTVELHDLNENATCQFTQRLIEAGHKSASRLNLEVVFPLLSSDHERCLWTLVNHRALYEACIWFDETARLKYHRCKVPDVEVDPGDYEKALLSDGLSMLSRAKGLGKGVVLKEHQLDGCRLFMCYLEHAQRRDLNFDGRSKLGYITRRPAYEIVFLYYPDKLILRTHVKGNVVFRREAEKIFGQTMLGVSDLVSLDEAEYDLSRFLEPGGCVLDVSDTPEIDKVSITRLSFQCYDTALDKVPVVLYKQATNIDVDNKIQKMHTTGSLGTNPEVAGVRLVATFRATVGRRASSVPVAITNASCSLNDEDPRHQLLMRLLKKWKIDAIEDPDQNAEDTGKSVQRVFQLSRTESVP